MQTWVTRARRVQAGQPNVAREIEIGVCPHSGYHLIVYYYYLNETICNDFVSTMELRQCDFNDVHFIY